MMLVQFYFIIGLSLLWISVNLFYISISFQPFDARILHQNLSEERTESTNFERYVGYHYHPPISRSKATPQNPELCGESPHFETFFARGIKERSASNEDNTIYSTFFRKEVQEQSTQKPHYYVELGAYNGARESNSRFFDECLHWEGILIEANPRVFKDLVKNRPHTHRLSFAPSCDERPGQTVGFWESAFENSAQDASKNRQAYTNDISTAKLVQVPCSSLTNPILDLLGPRVHFLSLDVEGMEPNVLENLDLNRIFVDVLIVENINQYCREKCPSRDRTRQILQEEYGYKFFFRKVKRSDLFVHPKSPYLSLLSEASS